MAWTTGWATLRKRVSAHTGPNWPHTLHILGPANTCHAAHQCLTALALQ